VTTTEIIEGEAVEVDGPRALVPVQPGQVIVTDTTPQAMLERATAIATALARMVEAQKLYTVISGKKYPQVEAWMTIGRMDNVVAREAHPPVQHDDGSWEATVELVRLSDVQVIGNGSALCGADGDRPWDKRPAHQRRSMAVTRATSRAFRQQYSWIMALAGYEPTPADEMPTSDFADSPYGHETDTTHDGGLIGTVAKGKPPVDLEVRQTPDGAAWGFKLVQGRKGIQALAIGTLAEALSTVGLAVDERVTVWGRIDSIPWQKDGKEMPPYQRVAIERVATSDWILPAPISEAETVPLFDDADQAAIDAALA
jgi:hypothetical protein